MVPDRLPRAYDAWLAAQRRVIELVEGADHPGTPVDRAEGYRWATRLAAIALEWVVEKNDPGVPGADRPEANCPTRAGRGGPVEAGASGGVF
jgi:hypothetical protein